MKVSFKKFAHYERMSEETLAFNADLCIDGKKVAEVSNEGHGGSCSDYFKPEFRPLEHQLSEIVDSWPGMPSSWSSDLLPWSMDTFYAYLAGRYQLAKTMKRHAGLQSKRVDMYIKHPCVDMVTLEWNRLKGTPWPVFRPRMMEAYARPGFVTHLERPVGEYTMVRDWTPQQWKDFLEVECLPGVCPMQEAYLDCQEDTKAASET